MNTAADRRQRALERYKRYRQRRRAGQRVVPVEIDESTISALVMAGHLSLEDAGDPELLAQVLGEIVEREAGAMRGIDRPCLND